METSTRMLGLRDFEYNILRYDIPAMNDIKGLKKFIGEAPKDYPFKAKAIALSHYAILVVSLSKWTSRTMQGNSFTCFYKSRELKNLLKAIAIKLKASQIQTYYRKQFKQLELLCKWQNRASYELSNRVSLLNKMEQVRDEFPYRILPQLNAYIREVKEIIDQNPPLLCQLIEKSYQVVLKIKNQLITRMIRVGKTLANIDPQPQAEEHLLQIHSFQLFLYVYPNSEITKQFVRAINTVNLTLVDNSQTRTTSAYQIIESSGGDE